jgi:hypothetical protein
VKIREKESFQLLFSGDSVEVLGRRLWMSKQEITSILRQGRLVPFHWGDNKIKFRSG